MPRLPHATDPQAITAFDAALGRIKEITGANTQVQLAEALGVRQSSISEAKHRASIPAEWLLKLQRKHHVFADWFLTGEGPRETSGGASARMAELEGNLHRVMRETEQLSDNVRNALCSARTTLDDLIGLKRTGGDMLSQAQKRIKVLEGQLRDMNAELAASAVTF